MELKIQLQNKKQFEIADLFWEATDQESVNLILRVFGHDAHVVLNMMIAASMDEVTDTNLAEQALSKIFTKE